MKLQKRRILIDICHPAEVHHFKHLYHELSARGWQILFAAKDKDVTKALLRHLELPHQIFSKTQRGLMRKLLFLPLDLYRFFRLAIRFKPTFILSTLSLHSSWVAALLGITHIGFADTEHRRLLDFVTVPFATWILTPQAYRKHWGRRQIRYAGNHELAYLFPGRFTANSEIRSVLGLSPKEDYVVLRFVAWQAFHDVGKAGLSLEVKKQLIRELEQHYRVFISSETELPEELQPYQLPTAPESLHDVLYYASGYIGEGGTTASEAACLGTPAVFISPLHLGYCAEEEQAGLLWQQEKLTESDIARIITFLQTTNQEQRLQQFLSDKIDVTAFLVWFFSRTPSSFFYLKHMSKSVITKDCGMW